MDMDGSLFSAHDSIYVAPLRIEKRCPSASSRTSRKSTPRTHKHPQSHSLHPAQHHIDFTPPTTPDTSEVPDDRSPDFHPFLRAFYPFHPTYTSGSSTVTLPLNSGDLILVHSVHTNGWADGTMLSSGARGWLPTNYCETYDTTHIRLLLRSSANLFEQFRVGSCGGARINQLAVSAVIAGVRHLLVRDTHPSAATTYSKQSHRSLQSVLHESRQT